MRRCLGADRENADKLSFENIYPAEWVLGTETEMRGNAKRKVGILAVFAAVAVATAILAALPDVPPGRVSVVFPPAPYRLFDSWHGLMGFMEDAAGIPHPASRWNFTYESSAYNCCLYDSDNRSLPTQGEHSVLSGSDDGSRMTAFYTPDGNLISIHILGPFGPPLSRADVATAVDRATAIADAMGLGSLSKSAVAWSGHGFVLLNGTTLYVPTVTVTLRSLLAESSVAYGNELTVVFDMEHLAAIELTAFPWFVASLPTVGEEVAFSKALSYLNETQRGLSLAKGTVYLAFDFLQTSLSYQVEAKYANGTAGAEFRLWVNAYQGVITYSIAVAPHKIAPATARLSGQPPPAWKLPMVASSASLLIALTVLLVEPITVVAFGLFVPLLVRFKRDNALDHFLRGQLYNYIVSNPGVTYSAIRNSFKISNGTTTYHLAVLELLGYVESSLAGAHKRYFPVGADREIRGRVLTELQKEILRVVKMQGVATPSEVARSAGISRQRAAYNLRKMSEFGLVSLDTDFRGRYKVCEVAIDSETGA